jgi:hypothetical protein
MKYLYTFNESVKDFLTYNEILDEIKYIYDTFVDMVDTKLAYLSLELKQSER